METHEIQLGELKKAVSRLKESIALPKTDITRDSSIQRFEFCVELSWKVLHKFLLAQGVAGPLSPKNAFREAAKLGLILNPTAWIEFIDHRNISSHTYREDLAEQVFASAKNLPAFVDELIAAIENHSQ